MEKMKVSKMIHNTHYNTKWATKKKKRLFLTSNMRDTQRSSIHWFTAPMPTTHQAGPDPSQKPWSQPTSLRVGTRDSTIRVTPQCLPGCTWARSQNWQRNQNSNQVPQHQKWVSSAAPRLFPHSGPYSCTFCCDEWKFTTWDRGRSWVWQHKHGRVHQCFWKRFITFTHKKVKWYKPKKGETEL